MIMETKPPSGHIAGEVGGFVGKELTLLVQRLWRILCGMLQQKLPELCLAPVSYTHLTLPTKA